MFFAPEDPLPRLAPGTRVGQWRIVEPWGYGAYGIVHRALRLGQEHSGPVALKLARYAWEPRFAREAELLSRLHHPSVPRLLGHGQWRLPSGAEHPYLVMQWVEGLHLYDWVEQQGLISAELLGPFAHLARALAATHAAQALHRDFKGDNIRVRLSDGRAFLIDFGSGHFLGATRLTWGCLPPGTFPYRSPSACLFSLRSAHSLDSYFQASPADDLFSLGVTLYRVATGRYPPELEARQDEGGNWYLVRQELSPLLALHPRLHPLLREWLLRLLSLAPEERGTAAELAEALEASLAQERAPSRAAVVHPVDSAARALAPGQPAAPALRQGAPAPASGQHSAPAEAAPPSTERPSGAAPPPQRSVRRAPVRAWRPWRALAALGLCAVLVWALQSVHLRPEGDGQVASSSDVPAPGPAAVGDSSLSAPLTSVHPPAAHETMAQSNPLEPHPRQARPDAKGQCPSRKQVALNGACWVENSLMPAEECTEHGYAYIQGKCYAPVFTPPERRLPTSSPGDAE